MFSERELDLIRRIPATEDNIAAIKGLRDRIKQKHEIQSFVMSWYGVKSIEDLPPEGLEWYKDQLRAAGWEDPEDQDE